MKSQQLKTEPTPGSVAPVPEGEEDRILLHEVRAVPSASDFGQMLINIVYEIKKSHDKRSMVYPFYLTPA